MIMKHTGHYDIELLYRQYHNDLYRYVLMLTCNSADAEDIVQNAFIKALRGLRQFRGDSSIKTWLFTIARNESIRYSQASHSYTSIDEVSTLLSGISIEDEVCSKAMTDYILSYILAFSEPKRSLFVLRLQEKTFVEIGEIIDKSDVWCRVTFMRAKNDLIKSLEAEFD